MSKNIQKTAMQKIREEILLNKEFFLLNFINDTPGEEELMLESANRENWDLIEMEFLGEQEDKR